MPTQSRKKSTEKKSAATPKRARSTKTDPSQPAPAPAPAQGDDRYAPTAWGSGNVGGAPQDLEMPSGQVALVRRPGIQQLIVEGVLHKMDSLTALVDKKYVKKGKVAKASDALDVQGLIGDPEALAEIMHTVDRVVCACVVKPVVHMTPSDITRRVPGVIYADSVDIQDKMFIFNWVTGGTRDLESFRRESEELVGSLAVGVPVESEAE